MSVAMYLDIVSLDQNIFSGSIDSVTFLSATGEITILPHHAPIITPIKSGEVVFRTDGKENYLVSGDGFCTVQNNKVTILVSTANRAEELDETKILAAQTKAEELVKNKESLDHTAFVDAVSELERSLAQMKFLQKHKKRSL